MAPSGSWINGRGLRSTSHPGEPPGPSPVRPSAALFTGPGRGERRESRPNEAARRGWRKRSRTLPITPLTPGVSITRRYRDSGAWGVTRAHHGSNSRRLTRPCFCDLPRHK
jgi:hypothetical protein